jgi:hypothetical protein
LLFRSFLMPNWNTTVSRKKCGGLGILSIHTLKGLVQPSHQIVRTPTFAFCNCASDIRTIEPSLPPRNDLIERDFIYVGQYESSLICAVILANPITFLALANRTFCFGSPKTIINYLASFPKMGLPILTPGVVDPHPFQ